MLLLFGLIAIVLAILNVIWMVYHREAKWFRYSSLSFTALTLCAEYDLVKQWVINEDWSALIDVVPNISGGLWYLTIASIILNGISLFVKSDK